jgi:hypothetical protein
MVSMFSRASRWFASGQKRPIRNERRGGRKSHLGVELLEGRVVPTTITQWSFSAAAGAPDNSPSPSTGTGTFTTLGMTNSYNGGNTANDDVLSTPGTMVPGFSEFTIRVRGTPNNGWATHAAGAAQYTQGIELDASTVGFSNIQFAFDWYSTTQGIRDLQFQYNTNIGNSAGWTNLGGTSSTGTYLATPNDYYNASSPPGTITVNLSGIAAANNDANFGVRLVSAYDSTGNVSNDYASATLSGGQTVIYNNSSGNWRFDNLTFTGTANGSTVTTSSAVTAAPVSPQDPGTSVVLTDTITPGSGSANPTGTVQFYEDGNAIGSAQNVSNGSGTTGVATLTVNTGGSPLTLGAHSFKAIYTPTAGSVFLTSTSNNLAYTIGDPTTTVVSASPPSPQQVGTNITFTATITPANIGGTGAPDGNPTGTVKFFDGATQIGTTQNVTNGSGFTGTASIQISTLASGTHNITAQYFPTANFLGSTSTALGYALYTGNPGPFTPGDIVVLQAGDGTLYASQAPLYLDEVNVSNGSDVQQPVAIPAVGAVAITAASESSTTVTITTGNAPGLLSNGFTSGEQIVVAGITPSGYDGTFTITTTGSNTFTYTAASGLGSATLNSATATPGRAGNQAITVDLSAAAGNGQLTRSYDGSALTFDGLASTINNGGLTSPATPTGQTNRDIAVVTGDATVTSNINSTTFGAFYMGDDNRGSVAESPTGPIYAAGHPNQAGGAVSQGVHEFDTLGGPAIGQQVSGSTNIRGVNIGFDNRMYFSTAGGLGGTAALNTGGIFTEAQALPNSATTTPANDVQVVPSIFTASKLGGLFLADMNGDGIVDNGDRLYFLDDGTVGGPGTGGLYVSTWNDSITANPWNTPNNAAAVAAGLVNHWSVPVRLGDAPVQAGSGGVGQLRGLAGTVIAADITSASESGSTVTITVAGNLPSTIQPNTNVQISGVGAGYDGSWSVTGINGSTFTYTALASGLSTVNNQGTATQVELYTSAYDNAANDSSYIQQWVDTNTGAAIANAKIASGTTVQITTLTPNTYQTGQFVEVDGVGANNGAGAISSGYNGVWQITVVDSTHFTYSDTNAGASGLSQVNNQGAADVIISPTTLQQLASGSDTVGNKSFGAIGLRGVAFAPVAATSLVLSQTPGNPLNPGTPVTLTATLSNSQVLPTGTVTFIDLNTNTVLGSGAISTTSNVTTATFTTTFVGNHYVQAYFAGGGPLALASSRSNIIQVIEAGSTASATVVTSSLPAVAIGKPVTLTATVSDNSGGSGTPSGTVTFYSGSVAIANILGTSALNTVSSHQVATLTAAFSTAGPQTIVAVYNGDNTFATSQGQTVVQVAPNATAVITPSANNVALGSVQTYTVKIIGNGVLGAPTGSVVFNIVSATTNTSGVPLVNVTSGSITLNASLATGTAQWTGPALTAPGSYFVTVSYTASGSTNPYSNFAVNTTSAANGVALVETVKQAFTPGNLVAIERGDGTVNLGSSAYPVFLDEYTPAGALVQAIALPNVDAGTQHALFLSGQNGAEGLLNRSANGYFLTLSGYDLPVGHTFITSTFPYQFPRTVAEINGSAGVDTSTAVGVFNGTGVPASISAASESGTTVTITTSAAHGFLLGQNVIIAGITPAGYDGSVIVTSVTATKFTYTAAAGLGSATLSSATATPAGVPYNPLDVVSNDGSEFWLAGSLPVGDTIDSGIEYVANLGASTATQLTAAGTSAAAIAIAGGQLYVDRGSGDVQTVGTGLPTTPGQSLAGLPALLANYDFFFTKSEAPEQFLLLNTSDGTTNNPNVAYIADQANGILKFWLNNPAGISTLTDPGTGNVTVTTSAAHTLVNGQYVKITGASDPSFNGTFLITGTTSTTFTYTRPNAASASATGGTAAQWVYGRADGSFGQKLVFGGGATGIIGFVKNPGASAQVQLYVTGSNVQQQNPNQLDSFLDTNGAPGVTGAGGTLSSGFPSGNVTILGFVGGASPSGSPNGNENFAGLAFVPGYVTSTTVADTGPGATNTFTATVTSLGGNVPTGVVVFSVDGTVVGQGNLNGSGVATFTDSSFPTDGQSHVITAAYQGDVKDGTSTGVLTQAAGALIAGHLLVDQVGVSVAISSITENGTTATVTTTVPHTLLMGQSVTLSQTGVTGYNTTFTITGVPSATTFTVTAASGLGSANTGVVTLNLSGSASQSSVDDYTTAGLLVQSINLPYGNGASFTEPGTTATEGYVSTSSDGHTAELAGVTSTPGNSTSGATRAVGVVNPNGSIESSTDIASTDTGSVRSVVSVDSLGLFAATSAGVRYVPFGNSPFTPTAQSSLEAPSPSTVGIGTLNTSGSGSGTPGQLFADAGAGAQSNGVPALDSPFTVGSLLPNNAGQAIAVSPSFPTARDTYGNFPTSAQFAISPDGNTIYIADSRTDSFGGILKYFQATQNSWTLISSLQLNSFGISDAKETSGTTVQITTTNPFSFPVGSKVEIDGVGSGYNGQFTITPTGSNTFTYTSGSSGLTEITNQGVATSVDGGLRGLVADFSGANPVFYATTSAATGNRIVKLTDGGDLNGNAGSGFSSTTLVTAAAGTAFRGVAFAPKAPGGTASTTSLAVTNNSSNYGTGVTLTATVTTGATGWVSFRQNGVEIGSAPINTSTHQAVLVTAGNLNAGSYSAVVAVYTGDGSFAPSTSSGQSATVKQQSTSTTLNANPTPVATGVPVVLAATIGAIPFSPTGTAPTGTVTYWDGTVGTGINLGTVNVSQVIVNVNGGPAISFVANLTTTFTTVATHSISAVYSGDVNFGGSTGTANVVVVNPTTVTVTTSKALPTASPSTTVTYTATVTSAGSGTITGSVQFYDDLLPIGSAVNVSGSNTTGAVGTVTINTALLQAASGSADVLTPGLHSISAVYTPDSAAQNTYFTSTGVYQQSVQGQPIAGTHEFVYRVGDGTTPLIAQSPNPIAGAGAIGSTIFVDDYNTATNPATLVQSLALPTADSQAFAVSTATESGNTVTLTTAAPNNFAMGDTITVAGVLLSGYNGTFTVTGATSTTVTYSDGTANLSNSVGGTIQGTVHAVVGNGQQSTTEQMTLSGDGQFLFLAGYDNNPLPAGTALPVPTASGSAAVPRDVARIKWDGTVQTEAFSGLDTSGNFNGVWSPDGSQIYVSGANGVQYFPTWVQSAALQTATTINSGGFTVNGLEGVGGNVYVIESNTANLVQQTTGFPTSSASLTSLSGVTQANGLAGGQASAFTVDAYFTHLSGNSAPDGINTMYLADDGPSFAGGAITKWALVSGTWKVVGHVTAGTGNSAVSFYWLSGKTDASGNVTLYATYGNGGNSDTGPGQLYSITDTNGFNAPIGTGGSASNNVSIIAAVGAGDGSGLSTTANEVFRGVAAAPSPAVTSVTVNANTFPIISVTESSSTVTVTTNGQHGFVPGESIVIAGVGVSGYNGVFTVASVADATHFTYTDSNTGLANATLGTASSAQAASATISTATSSGTTATITTATASGFTVGQVVTITGVSVSGYNGTFTIASVSGTQFTYTIPSALGSGSGGTAALNSLLSGAQRSMLDSITYTFSQPVTLGANAFSVGVHGTSAIATATESGNTVTITTAATQLFFTGQTITIAGVGVGGYNGTFTISVVDSSTFTYTDATSGLANSSGGTAGPGTAPGVSYLSPDGGITWVVTFTGSSVIGNSINDGVYDITLNQSAVTFNYSGATLALSNRTLDTFYRLYGDTVGHERVNATDYSLFVSAFGSRSPQANYVVFLDFEGNGRVNALDYSAFVGNFGKRLSGFTPTI